ncbi:MAG: alpha-amylase [Bacteroidales bacterium]|nr:alpha-amylase [Bacteroidales bacterium]
MRNIRTLLLAALLVLSAAACDPEDRKIIIPDDNGGGGGSQNGDYTAVTASPKAFDGTKRADITYQLLVYSFADSDGDGWGDIKGITQHLDYLDAMGASALWLSPIHPSDSYHGYDVRDYFSIHPKLGTEADFQELINKAHQKNIKIYLDYVLNHSGTGCDWFKQACASASSPYRDYYLLSSDPAADISAGKFPSLSGYDAGKWHTVSSTEGLGYTGRLHFKLDWSAKTVTVTETTAAAQASNTDSSVNLYIYYGNDKIARLYKTGTNIYEITLDFASDWGFLVRTSSTSWDNGTKYGASGDTKITFGQAKTLTNSSSAANITFGSALYYYGAFGSWMPDFHYGSASTASGSAAFTSLAASADKWINMGVDGFRLDAVIFIYEKNAPSANATFLKSWYDRCNSTFKAAGGSGDIYMVGEAWTDAGTISQYYKGLPALFDFPYWDKLSWALNNATGRYFCKDVIDLRNTYRSGRSDFIEATKLTNHDQTRAATTLGRSLPKEKMAACVLLTSPGNPYIYQGEELGYWGKKGEDGGADEQVRTPVKWTKSGGVPASWTSASNIDSGMLSANISVEAQDADSESLLNVYKRFAQVRNTYPALASGEISKHGTYNDSNATDQEIAAWYMTSGGEKLLVIHNFSSKEKTLSLEGDKLSDAIALNGEASVKGSSLRLGAWSSVVFLQ